MLYESNYYGVVDLGNVLEHHGIKGQKWGIRRFQNPDGTLTALGKRRYGTVENFKRSQERSARRKEAAKKIAKGVAIGAAVGIGTAIAAKKIKDINFEKEQQRHLLDYLNSEVSKKLSSQGMAPDSRLLNPMVGQDTSKMSRAQLRSKILDMRALNASLTDQDSIFSSMGMRSSDIVKKLKVPAGSSGDMKRKVMEEAFGKDRAASLLKIQGDLSKRRAKQKEILNAASKLTYDDLKKKNRGLFNDSVDSILKDMPRTFANMTMDDLRKLDLY